MKIFARLTLLFILPFMTTACFHNAGGKEASAVTTSSTQVYAMSTPAQVNPQEGCADGYGGVVGHLEYLMQRDGAMPTPQAQTQLKPLTASSVY